MIKLVFGSIFRAIHWMFEGDEAVIFKFLALAGILSVGLAMLTQPTIAVMCKQP